MFKKLLCAVALASVALAQDVTIVQPVSRANVTAEEPLTVRLQISQTSGDTFISESLVIAAIACEGGSGCPDPSDYLGSVLYSGTLTAQSTDSTDIQVTAPSWFDGAGLLNVAHFYLDGAYGTPELQITSTPIYVVGASG